MTAQATGTHLLRRIHLHHRAAFRMDTAVTFIILLGCSAVCQTSPRGRGVSFSMVFSAGTRLLVNVGEETADWDEDDDDPLHRPDGTGSSGGPSVQIFSSVRLSPDPGSPQLLVCLLTGLNSPVQHVLWWLDDTLVTSVGSEGPWPKMEGGYSATSVWEVSAADWRSASSYWCGTIQEGRVYRYQLCSED